ncbi:hypothetical protein [Sinisalibacter lacisalsi]|uniref:Uncharacterized protein n=1 Tax=Sinisalibacter lacisalsi TaxID=1526570 RepID=A0ABQ1QSW0_9RHOB|nr:hypothetical protein [Sinisalibacter lacisalsi]GGD43188.1 hypothetical protein GCM10011358_28780 [Sinisalibacter lacisalsi]
MILVLVMIGFAVGGSAAVMALAGGGGMLAALAAYGLFSLGAVVLTALIVALAPVWPTARARAERPAGSRAPVISR